MYGQLLTEGFNPSEYIIFSKIWKKLIRVVASTSSPPIPSASEGFIEGDL